MRRSKIFLGTFLGTSWGVRPYERQNKTLLLLLGKSLQSDLDPERKRQQTPWRKCQQSLSPFWSPSQQDIMPYSFHLWKYTNIHIYLWSRSFSFIEFVIFASQHSVLTTSSHGNGIPHSSLQNWERIVHFGRGLRWTFPWLIVKGVIAIFLCHWIKISHEISSAVIWPKYCRYGEKHYIINRSTKSVN